MLCNMDKNAASQWARRVVIFLLLGWFLGQCGNSLKKLMARSVGTAEGTGHEKEVLYPSVTVCPIRNPINGSYEHLEEDNLTKVYESWVGLPEKHLLRLWHTFVMGNDIEIEILEGGNFSALIEDGTISEMTLGYKVVDRCVTYNPPMKSRPGFDGRIEIVLNTTDLENWIVFVHNRNMMYITLSQAFGSTHFAVYPQPINSKIIANSKTPFSQYSYEIKRTKWTLQSTTDNPCSNEDIQQIDTCIEEHYEEHMGCSLPWTSTKGQGQTCPHKDLLDFYDGLIDTGIHDVTIGMGCQGSCKFTEYTLRHVSTEEKSSRYGPNVISVLLMLTSGTYKVKEQYFLYELSDFVSDVGGYLGLLLGQSLLTCYDVILSWIQKKHD